MPPIRALLVDDEPELVFTIAERLELRGFEVVAVTSAEEALTHLGEGAFDVGVFDVKMPGMGGIELLLILRQRGSTLPVILLTGHGGSVSDDLGAQGHLFKPVKIDVLIETMKRCVEESG